MTEEMIEMEKTSYRHLPVTIVTLVSVRINQDQEKRSATTIRMTSHRMVILPVAMIRNNGGVPGLHREHSKKQPPDRDHRHHQMTVTTVGERDAVENDAAVAMIVTKVVVRIGVVEVVVVVAVVDTAAVSDEIGIETETETVMLNTIIVNVIVAVAGADHGVMIDAAAVNVIDPEVPPAMVLVSIRISSPHKERK